MGHVPRIYRPGHLGPGPVLLDGEPAKRLAAVMRVREGDEVRLFSGDGKEWQGEVTGVSKANVHVQVGAILRQEAPPPVVAEVWCALVRANRFDWAIEKCTEAGVDIIRPLLTERTGRGEGDSAAKRQRWQRIAIEAAEQSGRLQIPVIEPAAKLADLLARHRGAVVVGDPAGKPWTDTAALLPPSGHVALVIGPEGGFSDNETMLMQRSGALHTRMGPNVFRTETAALASMLLLRAATVR